MGDTGFVEHTADTPEAERPVKFFGVALGMDGDGVKLTRIIGTHELNMLDLFLLLDAFESDQPQDYIGGFPDHPHRGFETVTYLLAGREVERAWIGVKVSAVGGLEPGLEVVGVAEGGPADRVGLEVGDTILRLGGRRIGTFEELRAFLREVEVGERIRTGLKREDRLLELQIEAGRLTEKS